MKLNDLSKPVGPLPLGAWIVAVVVGVGLVIVTRRNSGGEPAIYTDDNLDQIGYVSGVNGVGVGPGWVAVPTPTGTPPSEKTETEPETVFPETNDAWGRRAVLALIKLGADPMIADSAIRKYLEGETQSVAEYTLTKQALGLKDVGPPPTLLPAPIKAVVEVIKPPAPPAPPAPRKLVRYVKMAGSYAVYAEWSDKTLEWLSADQWAALGNPAPTILLPSSPVWNYRYVTGARPDPNQITNMLKPPVSVPAAVKPAPTPAPAPAPAPPAATRTYTVVRGDNLTRIGQRFGVSWQTIYNANRNQISNPNLIHPGQVLVIP